MAEMNFTTKGIITVTENLVAIRAIGDLLTAAADSVSEGRSLLHDKTLAAIGYHLEDLATGGLVILSYQKPQPKPEGGQP